KALLLKLLVDRQVAQNDLAFVPGPMITVARLPQSVFLGPQFAFDPLAIAGGQADQHDSDGCCRKENQCGEFQPGQVLAGHLHRYTPGRKRRASRNCAPLDAAAVAVEPLNPESERIFKGSCNARTSPTMSLAAS